MDELLEKKKYDRTYVEIDLDAIKHNIRCEREKVGDKVKIMAIIKANAYGHGDIEVAEALKDEVDAYGVAIIEEALKLRKAGVAKMILILGHTGKIWYEDLIKNDISQAVYSYEMAKILSEEAMRLGKKAKIHIKVDTGMGRIGFQSVKDNIEVIYAISRLPGIEIEGIFTHFARADEVSTEWTKEPFEKFQIFRHELQKRGVEIPVAHVANSASILRLPSTYLDMVRSGITTYGLFPSDEVKKNVHFRPGTFLENGSSSCQDSSCGNKYQLWRNLYRRARKCDRYDSGRLCGWSEKRFVRKGKSACQRLLCANRWANLYGSVYDRCDRHSGG